jgi:hypothetical protein
MLSKSSCRVCTLKYELNISNKQTHCRCFHFVEEHDCTVKETNMSKRLSPYQRRPAESLSEGVPHWQPQTDLQAEGGSGKTIPDDLFTVGQHWQTDG